MFWYFCIVLYKFVRCFFDVFFHFSAMFYIVLLRSKLVLEQLRKVKINIRRISDFASDVELREGSKHRTGAAKLHQLRLDAMWKLWVSPPFSMKLQWILPVFLIDSSIGNIWQDTYGYFQFFLLIPVATNSQWVSTGANNIANQFP